MLDSLRRYTRVQRAQQHDKRSQAEASRASNVDESAQILCNPDSGNILKKSYPYTVQSE